MMCGLGSRVSGPSHQNSESLLSVHFFGPTVRFHVCLHDSAPHTRIPNFSCLNICVGYMYELIFGFMIRPLTPDCQFCLIHHLCGLCVWVPVWLYDSAPHTRIPTSFCLFICVGYMYELIFGFMIRPLTPDCQICLIDHLCGLCVWVPIWLYDSAPHTRIPTCFVSSFV
jgi:hypothetical protein